MTEQILRGRKQVRAFHGNHKVMSTLEAIILGIVQGIAEFLPVSSSGHLQIAKEVLGVTLTDNLTFDVMLHVATVMATVVVLWSEVTSSGVENWLAGLRSSRASNRTSNAYLAKLKAFSNWMVNVRYASGNPLSGLRKLNEAADRRLERRALEEDEIGRLLWAAKQGSVVNGLAGHERALLYRLAIKSGLRWNEYRTLLKGDFDFDRCTVAIRAANAKNGRDAEQSLCAELTAALKGYMALFLPSPRRFPECGKVGAVG